MNGVPQGCFTPEELLERAEAIRKRWKKKRLLKRCVDPTERSKLEGVQFNHPVTVLHAENKKPLRRS
jgi:hypothetical protein